MKVKKITELDSLKYLKGYGIDYITKEGNSAYWELVSRAGIERLESEIFQGKVYTDGAMIVASDKAREHLVMIREYRVSAGKYLYMFPAGLIDDGEQIEQASIREFKEETGLTFSPVSISTPRYVSVGIVNERVNVAYGYYSGTASTAYQTEHEEAEIIFVDREKANQILEHEEISIRSALILEHFFKLNVFIDG
ncbi:NUDIX hydrolase [Fusibacter ferrireducens]|uniref:NUDIX hydrolase n=1 Tax=Fusibacter ferrireducens TaxID=2785058 RepID=A0ABR9ZR79_9FIRM|nr:NUDIX hydrolase [Fusibacter ferrireducens]MBF4692967.1 NUDIX hydrolase [Fusibacter ferrireducens]